MEKRDFNKNKAEAFDFIATIDDVRQRILSQSALGGAIFYLMKSGQAERVDDFDFLTFVKMLQPFLDDQAYLDALNSGRYQSLEEAWEDLGRI